MYNITFVCEIELVNKKLVNFLPQILLQFN
jgi:hypothetical protein